MSDVWAVASLVTTTTSPATASDFGSRSPSSGAAMRPGPHVVVVGGVALPRRARRAARGARRRAPAGRRAACRRTRARARGARRRRRTRCGRPRRRAGRRGRRRSRPVAPPPTGVTVGSGCRPGCGKAASTRWSSTPTPAPVSADSGSTGWKVPWATAVRRSFSRVGDVEVLALEVAVHEAAVLGLLDDPLDEGGPVRVEHVGVLRARPAHRARARRRSRGPRPS